MVNEDKEKRNVGRPKEIGQAGKMKTFYLSMKAVNRIKLIAELQEISQNEVVRIAIDEYYKKTFKEI